MAHVTDKCILKEPNLVVAIDIGSTYSGYAWQWRKDFLNNRSNVEFNTNWGAGAVQLHKTTTCLLLNNDHQVDSFGQVAENRFCNSCSEADGNVRGNWFFFKGFKLILYGNRVTDDLQVDDYIGQQLLLMDVMSKFIWALTNRFIKSMKYKGTPVNMDETLWVVTVPAIWTDKAKKFMRDAAEKSGISRKHLLLANEPESAALYCMHLPLEQRKEMNDFGGVGDKFLTVDLGGGTLDMSAIEILQDGNVKEICAGAGSRVGGHDVNYAFMKSCKDVIGGEAWSALSSKNADEVLEIENDFERKKVQIGAGANRDERFNVPIPSSMRSLLADGKVKLNAECEYSKYFKIETGKLLFKSALIREVLFQETVELTLKQVNDMLQQGELRDIRTIVLVGGFAESQMIVEKIRTLLSKKFPHVKAVIPTSPFRAVLKGAVMFGHDPLIFLSRISRATFGVGTNRLFDSSKDDERKKWTNTEDGKDYCKDVLSVHVRKGQSVKLKEPQPSWSYNPMYKTQTEMALNIYASPEQEPVYTSDVGCKIIGHIKVELPNTEHGTDRTVNVEMIYGGTELSVQAMDETSGKVYPTDIKFDTF